MNRAKFLVFTMMTPFAIALFTGVLGLAYASIIPASILFYSLLSEPPSGFKVERSIDTKKLAVGKSAAVRTKLIVERGAGLVFIDDVISPGLEVQGDNRCVFIKYPGKVLEVEYTYKVMPKKKGIHSISPVEVIGKDFWGIQEINYRIFGDKISIEARPRVGKIRMSTIRRIRTRKHGLPVIKSSSGVSSREFKEIREYRPGDQVKDINWKASARLGTLLSNEYEHEAIGTVMIYVDTTTSMGAGDITKGALESALSLSLSLINALLRTNLRVGLYLVGASKLITPRTGIQAFSSFMKSVLSAGPSLRDRESLNLAIERSRHIPNVNIAVIITNLLPYREHELRETVRQIKRTFGCRIIVVDINPYGSMDESYGALATLQKAKLLEDLGVQHVEWNTSKEDLLRTLKKTLRGISYAV